MRVNLLPPEVRRSRRDSKVLRQIRFAGMTVLFLLIGLYGIRSAELAFLRGDLDDLRAEQAAVEAERQALGDVAAARDALLASRALSSQLLRGEISWSGQMLRLSATVPSGFTLTSMGGTMNADSAGPLVGSVTFSATSRELLSTRSWLIGIAAEEGWANGWVSSLSADEGGFSVGGSFDLTAASLSPRGGGPA